MRIDLCSHSEQVFTHEILSIPVLTKQIVQKHKYKASQPTRFFRYTRDMSNALEKETHSLAARTASEEDSGPSGFESCPCGIA